jgi:hypothetical protein
LDPLGQIAPELQYLEGDFLPALSCLVICPQVVAHCFSALLQDVTTEYVKQTLLGGNYNRGMTVSSLWTALRLESVKLLILESVQRIVKCSCSCLSQPKSDGLDGLPLKRSAASMVQENEQQQSKDHGEGKRLSNLHRFPAMILDKYPSGPRYNFTTGY